MGPSTADGSFEPVQNSAPEGAYLEVTVPNNGSIDKVQNPTPDGVPCEVTSPNDEVDNVDDSTANSSPCGMAWEVVAPNDAVGSADQVVENSAPDGIAVEVFAPSDAVWNADKKDGVSLEVVGDGAVVPIADAEISDAQMENELALTPYDISAAVANILCMDVPKCAVGSADGVMQDAAPVAVHP